MGDERSRDNCHKRARGGERDRERASEIQAAAREAGRGELESGTGGEIRTNRK